MVKKKEQLPNEILVNYHHEGDKEKWLMAFEDAKDATAEGDCIVGVYHLVGRRKLTTKIDQEDM